MLNDRLEIASRLLINDSEYSGANLKWALDIADKLIAVEKETRPKEATQECEPFNTAACHVKKGQYVNVNCVFKQVINIDNEVNHNNGHTLIWLYFNDNTSEMYSYNEDVTVKDKAPN